jgi:hypothetical protein
MAGIKITRVRASEARHCQNNMHPIPPGAFYCHVDLAPGQPRRSRSDWGYEDAYCEPCGTEKYVRYRRILANIAKLAEKAAATVAV